MIIEVQDYNTQVEFPDNMAPTEIQKVLARRFPPKEQGAVQSSEAEPIPFDLDGVMDAIDPQQTANRSEVTSILYPFVHSFLATGYTTAAALNRGIGTFATHLNTISDYISSKTGAQKGGIFEAAAKQYNENAAYWQERANTVGVSFLEELFGEAIGGAVPGVSEFALNIPYAGLLGAAEAEKEGKGDIAGALTEAAKRGVLGAVFKAMGPLNQYLRAPAMGTVFGLQAGMEGGDTKEIVKGFGTGALYSLTSPGGQMGLNEIRANLEKKIVLEEARKPVEIPIESDMVLKMTSPKGTANIPPETTPKAVGGILKDSLGNPSPEASISTYGIRKLTTSDDRPVYNFPEYYGLSHAGAAPDIRIPIEAKSGMTYEEMKNAIHDSAKKASKLAEEHGFDVNERIDGYGNPVFDLVHRATKKEYDRLVFLHNKKWEGAVPVFIRYGKLPPGGRSKNYADNRLERGVSVFEGRLLPSGEVQAIPKHTYELGSLLMGGLRERPVYVVKGEYVGIGSDGEPLLRKAKLLTGKEAAKEYFKESLPNPSRPPEGGGQSVPLGEGSSLAMAPEAGFRREPSSVSGKSDDPITRRSDLVRFLTEKLDIPIRTGRFRDKALGIFKPKSEVIRTEKANDIEVISHEIGHALQKFLYPETLTAKGLSAQPFESFKGELEPLATTPKAGQEVAPEGFAEFVRLYVTNPMEAKAKAPSFYQHFEHLLETKSPESMEILLAARSHYQKWLEQPALQRVLSSVSVGENQKRATTLDDVYAMAIDDLHPLKQAVKEMTKGRKILVAEDPYKLARIFRGWQGKVDAFLRHKPFEFKTYHDVGKSFQEIVKPIDGKLDEFRAYIVSKRTLELEGRAEPIETGILPADAREVVTKYDPVFSQTFKDLKEYQEHTLNYLRDSGVIGKDIYAKIKALNDDYAPLYRIMEQTEGKTLGGDLQARNPVKKIKGSWRDIQDPLESIIKNTYLYINMAEKNAIGDALVKMAEKTQGLGKFIEKIPTQMQGTKITPEELAKYGLENIPEEAITIFRPSAFQPKDNVITVYRDGKPELYQVHPDIARTFQALDKESVNTITKLLSYPASWLRAGATLTPEFISRNPLRDQFSAMIYSKYGFVPGVDLARGIFNLAGKSEIYWDWKKGGGDHSMLVSMDRAYLQDQLADVLQKYPVRNLIKNPIEALRVLSELGEAGTRIGEFGKGIQKEGSTKEGIQAAAFASREVTIDFARIGAAGKAMNMITAFWNASLQGNDRMIRAFIEDPSGAAWKTAVAITLPSILLAIANNDDPRMKDVPQWQKDLFWIVPTENALYRVPKPFEMGIIFGSIPERITRYILDQDSHAFDGLLESLSRAGMPGFIPTGALPLIENITNHSFFFDRPVVPQNKTEMLSEYQYGPYTTETAKAIGKVLGKLPWANEGFSPAKIENLVYGWTGGMGRYALNLADASLEAAGVVKPEYEAPAKALADYPLIKAFVVRYPSASTENITRFYDNYDQIQKRINTYKALAEEGRFDEMQKIVEGGSIENLNGFRTSLRNIHSMVDSVTINPTMNPDEKREIIDILYMQMTDIAKAGNELVDTIKEVEKQARENMKTTVNIHRKEPARVRPVFEGGIK